jgi:DNA-binding transcriptional MerR regulator
MPRPEKYETHVKPHLTEIKALRESGMKLEAIAKQLKISHESLYKYQREYPEFAECLQTAREKLHADMLIAAEDSLLAKLKDRYEEVETITEEFINKEGEIMTKNIVKTRVIPADTTAIIWALKNRDPKNWKDRTELDARVLHTIPQPLAPVRQDDLIIDAEVLELEAGDEADNSV